MNRCLKIIAASFVLLLLSACASTHKTTRVPAAPMQGQSVVVDERYVALVESMAKQRGTRVMWVNAPTKRVVMTASTR